MCLLLSSERQLSSPKKLSLTAKFRPSYRVDLTYFDKSIRRPSCLYSSPNELSSANNWTDNSIDNAQQQGQPGPGSSRPSLARASGSLEDPPTTSVSSSPECSGAYGCTDCCQPPSESNLARSVSEVTFDNDTMAPISEPPTPANQTWQRRAALARLHRQQSTATATVSFSDGITGRPDENEQPSIWHQRLADWSEQLAGRSPQTREAPDDTQRDSKFRIFSEFGQQNCLMLLLKLLLVILVANLVLKLTDSLSCALITMLSFPSSSSSAAAGSLANELQAAAAIGAET